MSTYYNYVRRGPESQVDWGKIGTDISTEISRISKDREAKKTELDKLGTDLIRSASQVTLPEQDYVKNIVLDGTNEMKNLALQQNKLLKQGKITPSQYRMVMENMKTNVDYLGKAVKDFNPSYKRDVERLAKDEMGFEEEYNKQNLFNYGNLENKVMFLNADGNMYLTDIDKDGNPVADPKNMISFGMLSQGISATEPKYDVKAALEEAYKSIGSVTEIIRAGGVESEESIRRNPKYEAARDSYISMMIDDRAQLVEIMGGYYGGYNVVKDESKAGGKNLYIGPDQKFRPTDQQKEDVRKRLTEEFDAMVTIDRKSRPASSGGSGLKPKPKEEFKELYEFMITDLNGNKVTAEDAILATGANVRNIETLKTILRRLGGGITAEASGSEFSNGKIKLSAPGASTIVVTQNDLEGLRDGVEQIRTELYGSTGTPSGGSGSVPGGSSR